MIDNTELLYIYLKEFQNKRKGVTDTFKNALKRLEAYKGSTGYDTDVETAEKARNNGLTALKDEYTPKIEAVITSMRNNNAGRTMAAPSDAELNILQLLKMRDKLSETELITAANALKNNAAALEVLNEIADKTGQHMRFDNYYTGSDITVKHAESAINDIVAGIRDFLEYDTTKASRRVHENRLAMYNNSYTDADLTPRALFDTKAGCYSELFGMSNDGLTAFCNAVD